MISAILILLIVLITISIVGACVYIGECNLKYVIYFSVAATILVFIFIAIFNFKVSEDCNKLSFINNIETKMIKNNCYKKEQDKWVEFKEAYKL